ncbi:MAG: PhnD/SsuA/transferrin family substrate-binding protein [Pseudomonadota bacterium]
MKPLYTFCSFLRYLIPFLIFTVTVQAQTLSFAPVPQGTQEQVKNQWQPVVDKLNSTTGLSIQLTVAKSITDHSERLGKGEFDLAYANPAIYVAVEEKGGYKAFAKQSNKMLQGVIVVRNDSPAKDLADVADEIIATPDPAAFGASILPLKTFEQAGVDVFPEYYGSHTAAYMKVHSGEIAVSGGVNRTFNALPADIRKDLRILKTTDQFKPHPFVASNRLSGDTVDKIGKALAAITSDQALRKTMKFNHPVVQADPDNWDDVRSLGIRIDTVE